MRHMMRGASALGVLILFFLLLIALGFVWVATGGPSRPISHSGFFLSAPQAPGVNRAPGAASGNGEDLTPVNSTPAAPGVQSEPEKKLTALDYFFNFRRGGSVGKPDSPYATDVELRVGNTYSDDPNSEYMVLTSRNLEKNLTITGWTVESTVHGVKVPLGQAAYIPYLGQVNAAVPVTIGPNSTVYVVTGRAPNGTSFRVNVCTGYFEQYQDFTPYLRSECPNSENEALLVPQKTAGIAACIDFINRLSSCQMYTGAIPLEVGSSCRDFIVNDLTYQGCVERHKNDPDFYKNEWRIYLNRDQELWAKLHDQILLRDENGKLIAVVEY